MAELHRKKTETYFSWLPRDVTTMIDAMGRPIEKGPLRLQRELGERFFMKSGGQELIRAQYNCTTGQPESHFFSLFEEKPIQVKTGFRLIDLRGPGDQDCMYSDGCLIYLNDLVYQINLTTSGPLLIQTGPTISSSAISINENMLSRGTHGYIYLVYQNKLYRFHLSVMVLEHFPCPPEIGWISWVRPSLILNSLIVANERLYRWDLDTNTLTVIDFPEQWNTNYVIDPATCLVYALVHSKEELKLIREDGQTVIDLTSNHQIDLTSYFWQDKCYITLSGHFIFQLYHLGKFTAYLYG